MSLSYDNPEAMGGTNKKLPKLTYKPKSMDAESTLVKKPTLEKPKPEENSTVDKLIDLTKRGAFVEYLYEKIK